MQKLALRPISVPTAKKRYDWRRLNHKHELDYAGFSGNARFRIMNIGESGLASPERRLRHDEAERVARHAVFADFTGPCVRHRKGGCHATN